MDSLGYKPYRNLWSYFECALTNHCVPLALVPVRVDLPLDVDDVPLLEAQFSVILRLEVVERPRHHLVPLVRPQRGVWRPGRGRHHLLVAVHVCVAVQRHGRLLARPEKVPDSDWLRKANLLAQGRISDPGKLGSILSKYGR